MCCRQRAGIAEALAHCDQAIRIDPRCAEAYDGKGTALYVLRRFEEALASYDTAVALRPASRKATTIAAMLLQQLKRSS